MGSMWRLSVQFCWHLYLLLSWRQLCCGSYPKTLRAFSIESSVSLYGRNPLSDLDGFRGIVWGGDAALSISALRNQTARTLNP
jgi:hypothetical protein